MFSGKDSEAQKCNKGEFDAFLCDNFDVIFDEEIPHCDDARVIEPPLVWRYFVVPNKKGEDACLADDDYVVKKVMIANTKMDKRACFFSSGKNMGVFKGVGFLKTWQITSCFTTCMRATSGPLMEGFRPTPRLGGVERILSASWTGQLSTTERSPHTAQISGTWRCTDTPALS
jgi:hypothetical protein